MFHQESNYQVQSDIAKNACILGTKHVFGSNKPFPDLYEMLIEAMSNTNNHASNNSNANQFNGGYILITPLMGTRCIHL